MELLCRRLAQIESDLLASQQSDSPMERYKRGKQVAEQGLRQLVALGRVYADSDSDSMEEIVVSLHWYMVTMDNHWIDLDKDIWMDIFRCWAWGNRIDKPWINVLTYSTEPLIEAYRQIIFPLVVEQYEAMR